MSSKELTLTDREQSFIDHLLDNGGNAREAAELAGYSHSEQYGYKLRRRLAKEIAEATQQYLAFNAPRAAKKLIDTMTDENPNPTQFAAAKDILDRAGTKVKEEVAQVNVKANIFILPEKKLIEEATIIDLEPV